MQQNLTDINSITAKINQTWIGLNGDLVIADLSQMPGVAKAQLKCMNAINWAIGKEGGTMAGLVFVDVVEAATRYVKSFWAGFATEARQMPLLRSRPCGSRPYQSAIYSLAWL